MAEHIDDGGPAFPVDMDHQTFAPRTLEESRRLMSGMTLRDYFAAKALQGLVGRTHTTDERGRPFVEWVAELSYELADQMLKARSSHG